MNGPLFSILVVCLDSASHISEALASVLAQDFEDFEIVVVDGGSTDGTVDILRAFETRFDGRMSWVSEHDDGIYDAMDRALERATGDYVEFLGADDLLRPGALTAVAGALEGDPRPDMVCGGTRVFGSKAGWDEPARRKIRRGMPQRAPSRHQSMFVRRSALQAVGGFDRTFRIAADYDAYLKLTDAGCREALIGETLSDFRLGGASSRDAVATARDYRDVRVSHGANLFIEGLVMWKSATAAILFSTWKRPA